MAQHTVWNGPNITLSLPPYHMYTTILDQCRQNMAPHYGITAQISTHNLSFIANSISNERCYAAFPESMDNYEHSLFRKLPSPSESLQHDTIHLHRNGYVWGKSFQPIHPFYTRSLVYNQGCLHLDWRLEHCYEYCENWGPYMRRVMRIMPWDPLIFPDCFHRKRLPSNSLEEMFLRLLPM